MKSARQTAGRSEALHQDTAGLHPLPVDGDHGEAGAHQPEGGEVGVVRPVVHLPVGVGPGIVRTPDTGRREILVLLSTEVFSLYNEERPGLESWCSLRPEQSLVIMALI